MRQITAQDQPRLLNVAEAAHYLGTTVWQVRTLTWEKKLPVIRLGKRLLFDRADLDRFVESLKAA